MGGGYCISAELQLFPRWAWYDSLNYQSAVLGPKKQRFLKFERGGGGVDTPWT